MLTDQDRAEIRLMIQQELNARGLANVATAGINQGNAVYIGGAIPAANPFHPFNNPNPNPQKVLYPNGGGPVTITINPPSPDILTASPEY